VTHATTPTNPSSPRSKRTDGIPSDYLPQIHGCRDSLQVSNIDLLLFLKYRTF